MADWSDLDLHSKAAARRNTSLSSLIETYFLLAIRVERFAKTERASSTSAPCPETRELGRLSAMGQQMIERLIDPLPMCIKLSHS
jgi:hypothetical protein